MGCTPWSSCVEEDDYISSKKKAEEKVIDSTPNNKLVIRSGSFVVESSAEIMSKYEIVKEIAKGR